MLHLPRLATDALCTAREMRSSSNWVFPNASGDPLAPWMLIAPFKELRETAGVRRITIHGLRHTCATMLLEGGSPMHAVSRFLGHSSVGTTMNVYAHTLSHSYKNLANEIDSGFTKPE